MSDTDAIETYSVAGGHSLGGNYEGGMSAGGKKVHRKKRAPSSKRNKLGQFVKKTRSKSKSTHRSRSRSHRR